MFLFFLILVLYILMTVSIALQRNILGEVLVITEIYFHHFFIKKKYIVSIHQNPFAKAILMITHNICLIQKYEKLIPKYTLCLFSKF